MSILQQLKQQELNLQELGEESVRDCSSEMLIASCLSESPAGGIRLLESILERENMERALKRVIRNKGAPGVDGMTVYQLKGYLKRHWPTIKLSRCHVGASSAPVLLRVLAPCLYTQKGNWCNKLLSFCKIMRSKPRTRRVGSLEIRQWETLCFIEILGALTRYYVC